MSDATDGRGLMSDEFDDDEIDWDDEDSPEGSSGLSPIEEMVGDSMDVVVPDEDTGDNDNDEAEQDEEDDQ